MIKYSSTQGAPDDHWKQCEHQGRYLWFEKNCTVQEFGQIPIWEPCNYASNLAYYHTVTEICKRESWNLPLDDGITTLIFSITFNLTFCLFVLVKSMATTFAILAQGSAFMHASKTDNGAAADVRLNDLFAYVAYQAIMKNVLPLDSPMI